MRESRTAGTMPRDDQSIAADQGLRWTTAASRMTTRQRDRSDGAARYSVFLCRRSVEHRSQDPRATMCRLLQLGADRVFVLETDEARTRRIIDLEGTIHPAVHIRPISRILPATGAVVLVQHNQLGCRSTACVRSEDRLYGNVEQSRSLVHRRQN